MDLTAAHFAEFFAGVHGCQPFPWQQRLVDSLAHGDVWPDVLDLPTGSGKTAAMDAAVFHLAMRAGELRRTALRIAFVVDRRIVVDDAYERARRISRALACAALGATSEKHISPVVSEVARRLGDLAERRSDPLVVQRLRGGAPLESDWARTPVQPTILCSTVDQVGSRLLFRGYGVSDRMRPVHAGLLGQDTLILLDEAHLSQPFMETVDAVRRFGNANVRTVLLTATPRKSSRMSALGLADEDRLNPTLGPRLSVSKPAKLTKVGRNQPLIEVFADASRKMLAELQSSGIKAPVVGVTVNRIKLAREVFDALRKQGVESLLLIGRCRSADREAVVRSIDHIKTGATNRESGAPLAVVATQCIEVGVDLDFDGLVTQAAPLDALRQRFGRLNRAGRAMQAEAEIIGSPDQLAKRQPDPVYGDRIRETWDLLTEVAVSQHVDFGIAALEATLQNAGVDLRKVSSPADSAPVLMPAYLHLWAQTSPVPSADPDVGLFLHGKTPVAPDVSLVWRDDIEGISEQQDMKDLLELMPPRTGEMLSVPIWAARNFLEYRTDGLDSVADVFHQTTEINGVRRPSRCGTGTDLGPAFRWAGANDQRTDWVSVEDIRAGDVLVLPATRGGCDMFGWDPNYQFATRDVADQSATPFRAHRHAVRVTRSTVEDEADWLRLVSILDEQDGVADHRLIDDLLAALPADDADERKYPSADEPVREIREAVDALHQARGPIRIHRYPDGSKCEKGAILVAEKGVDSEQKGQPSLPSTEDDRLSISAQEPVTLDLHSEQVREWTRAFVERLSLPPKIADDVKLAAYLHDAGKADSRFQAMLYGGDVWNMPEDAPLAKSTAWSRGAWERAGLPNLWRHEALSVRMAKAHPRLRDANDPELVLWLVGTHHGLGRPLYNFAEEMAAVEPLPCLGVETWTLDATPGPQSLAFDFHGHDWPALFERLKVRYDIWGLAHLEAVLRLADHRASEQGSR